MTEKDGPDKLFGETDSSGDKFSMDTNEEDLKEFPDNDEEIIELTDPDDTPVSDSEDEIIEPADFLDELSVEDMDFDSQDNESDDDIIELTHMAEGPGEETAPSEEQWRSSENIESEDKDLFIFTDTENEAPIEDDDLLSDTVFAEESIKSKNQHIDEELDILKQEPEEQPAEDGNIFDDTVLASDVSEDDEALSVLNEMDDTSEQADDGMFNDTVLSGESLENEDEELAILTEPEEMNLVDSDTSDSANVFIDGPAMDTNSDMVLLEDTEGETLNGEDNFIQAEMSDAAEGSQLEIEDTAYSDIADSLGLDLESDKNLFEEDTKENEVQLTIESQQEDSEAESAHVTLEAPEPITLDTGHIEKQQQTVSPPALSIPDDQIEKVIEKVVKKMFTEKMDSIIIDVIEKAIKTDIEKIKRELIKGTAEDL